MTIRGFFFTRRAVRTARHASLRAPDPRSAGQNDASNHVRAGERDAKGPALGKVRGQRSSNGGPLDLRQSFSIRNQACGRTRSIGAEISMPVTRPHGPAEAAVERVS